MSIPAVAGFATLPRAQGSRVVKDHPELGALDSPEKVVLAFTANDRAEAAELTDLLMAARELLASRHLSSKAVLEALLPARGPALGSAYLNQIHRNASAQVALAEEFGLPSSGEVAAAAHSRAANVSALASRWRTSGQVFAVDFNGETRYPGFQFDDRGRPRPVIERVLEQFDGRLSGWEVALWFTGASDWLGGVRPVDVLDTDPELVVEAAERLAAELLA